MADIKLNTRYLQSNRGIIKILQIVFGFIICSILCGSWVGGKSCFAEGRLGFCSGLNFVVVIINIVLFVINFLNIASLKLERTYSVVVCVLFLIASAIMVWFLIDNSNGRGWMVSATVLIIVEFLLFLWDVKILQGEASN